MANSLGNVIQDLRRRKFLSPVEFSEQVGIKETYLALIETDLEEPNRDVLDRMAKVLEMPVSGILFFTIEEREVKEEHKEILKLAKPLMENLMAILMDEDVADIKIPKP